MPTAAERYKFSEVESDGKTFISELLEQFKVHHVEDVKLENVMRVGNKDVIARQLVRALALIDRQHNLVINQRVHASAFQQEIIKLQSDVIDAQRKEMEQFKTDICEDITETVEESVRSSIESYSDVVQSRGAVSPGTSAVISQETLKKVVKEVAVEEELSRNVMVFGLPEEDSEQLERSVSEVFQQLGEKPSFEAVRLGKKKDSAVRPVRVVMSSVLSAERILGKSRNLRHSEKHKKVFLSPDRTVEERAQHKDLVQQLKKKAEEEPQRKHFIKSGQVLSVDRPN